MSTNIEMKKYGYKKRILDIVRQKGQVSRFDLKKITRYSMTTTLDAVDALMDEGLLTETGVGESTGGRKPTWLSINPSGGYFLGVDFNAEYVHAIILDFSGNIVYRGQETLSHENKKVGIVMERVKHAIREMLATLRQGARVFGIGLGIPGFIDMEKGTVLGYHFIPEWGNYPLKQEIMEEFGYPVFIENNVNAMALAHKWLDYGGNCEDLMFIAVRTGVRIAQIINNRLQSGRNNAAGEIDHMRLPDAHTPCECGNIGCLVSTVSNGAIIRKIENAMKEGKFALIGRRMLDMGRASPNIEDFAYGVRDADPDCLKLAEETAKYLGEALSYAIMLSNPSRVILSTNWIYGNHPCIQTIQSVVKARCPEYSTNGLAVELSRYGAHIGAIGAASIVMQNGHYLPKNENSTEAG